MNVPADLRRAFDARFGAFGYASRAPGRINLIGEHTDYNDGFVMPAAIGLYTWALASPRRDRRLIVRSKNIGQEAELRLDELSTSDRWFDYVAATAWALERHGLRLCGANLLLAGDLPLGSGLSSSASLQVAVAQVLLKMAGADLPAIELAKLCQRGENEFVGARCGLMDQFATCFGAAGHAVLLDCRSLEHRLLPLPEGVRLVVANTMVSHAIAAGEYNRRREQCEAVVAALRAGGERVESLRQLPLEELEQARPNLDPLLYRRARHVVTENERVLAAARALERRDAASLGALMSASHRSLRDDYEVSSAELDCLVKLAEECPGVFGARLTGGGFGGCIVALVADGALDSFRARLTEGYRRAFSLEPWIYAGPLVDGACREPAAA